MRTTDAGGGRIPNGEEEPHAGLPYWIVGLGLMGLVVVILVGAFVLDRQFRPRVGMEPPAVLPTEPTATAAEPVPTHTAQPTTTLPPSATPPRPATVTPTQTPAPLGTTVLTGKLHSVVTAQDQEVEQAYLHFWEVYSQTLYTLDTSYLPQVMTSPALDQAIQYVDQLKGQGHALKAQVEHHISLFDGQPGHVGVYDAAIDSSYLLDVQTHQPIPATGTPIAPEQSIAIYLMQRIDGVWKVVVAFQNGPPHP